MTELKSRIRIKRGTEDKISNSNDTLPEGSLLYNKTKNTLIISDGDTAIKNLKSLTSEKVSNGGILGDGISSDIFIWLDDQRAFNNSFIDSDARFTSNGVSYNKLEITSNQDIKYYVNNAATIVYNASTNTWANNNYKRIEIQAIGSFDNYKSRVYKGNREVSQIFEEESNKVKNASLADRAINSIFNDDGSTSGFVTVDNVLNTSYQNKIKIRIEREIYSSSPNKKKYIISTLDGFIVPGNLIKYGKDIATVSANTSAEFDIECDSGSSFTSQLGNEIEVIKYQPVILPQKVLLWEGERNIVDLTPFNISAGDILEFVMNGRFYKFLWGGSTQYLNCSETRAIEDSGYAIIAIDNVVVKMSLENGEKYLKIESNYEIQMKALVAGSDKNFSLSYNGTGLNPKFYKVYKIIE